VPRLIQIVCILLVSATSLAAKDWRGILPMHSTRADVEALLGPPKPPPPDRAYMLHKGRSIYFLEEGEVYIVFAEEELSAARECLSTVPRGTVLMIQITPKDATPLSNLNLDEKRFRKFDASVPTGHGYEGFVSEEEGFVVRAFKGKVELMVYVGSAVDRPRCPTYYPDLEDFVRTGVGPACGLSRFREYGDISRRDENAVLDSFAIQLLNTPDARGHIIVYAGQKATVGEAVLRAQRIKDYLVNVRKISSERVNAIDGGYRVDFSVVMYLIPPGAEPPPPMPTLDPSAVELIYEKKKRTRRNNH
jgi:hypothetical protein